MKTYLAACLILLAHYSPAQSVNYVDTSSYILKVKLLQKGYAPDCGIVYFAVGQKFEVVASSFDPAGKKLVLIADCPEMFGRDFLSEGKVYTARIYKTLKKPADIVTNDFKKENLPTYWIAEIKFLRNG